MDIKDLKERIISKTLDKISFIFVSEDYYLPLSYIKYIKDNLGYKLNYIEKLDDKKDTLLFDTTSEKIVDIFIADTLATIEYLPENTIVLVKKFEKDLQSKFNDNVVIFPKVEAWQIEDYCKVLGKGLSDKNLKWLLNVCNYNLYRLDSELNKINIFPEKSREAIFELLKSEYNFGDLSCYNVFSLSNALLIKDKAEILSVLKDSAAIDINAMGLLTILNNNFKNIINIQLGLNSTAESLGMNPKQFIALKYRINRYSRDQLISIIDLLTKIDYEVKSGKLPIDILPSYMILKILNM